MDMIEHGEHPDEEPNGHHASSPARRLSPWSQLASAETASLAAVLVSLPALVGSQFLQTLATYYFGVSRFDAAPFLAFGTPALIGVVLAALALARADAHSARWVYWFSGAALIVNALIIAMVALVAGTIPSPDDGAALSHFPPLVSGS